MADKPKISAFVAPAMIMIGLLVIAAQPGLAQAPDPFQSAPGPAPPTPKPHRRAPTREAEPAIPAPAVVSPAVLPSASAPPARPPGQVPGGAFEGTYTGSVTGATKAVGGRHRNCTSGGTVRMIIRSIAVFVEQAGRPDGSTLTYRGTVDAGGAVSASATNADGIVHTVAGKISQGRFTGEIRRTNCSFSVDLVKG